jgi:signal transduction histidine kinase/CheY-like chemotaxis protein
MIGVAHAISDSTLHGAAALLMGAMALLLIGLWRAVQRSRTAETARAGERVRLEAEIAAHARTDAALLAAREVAEAANLAKSRYLVGVSHEIRSPLNAIHGYAQLLERDGQVDPVEAARVIRRSSQHLIDIVDGLLDISRIETGQMKLNRDLVPLPAFLESLADMFRGQAAAKGLGFVWEPPANLPAYVRIDEKRLRQLLINLLSNAVKYTESGTITLAVRTSGMVAEFSVSDTGIGLDDEELSRIFEPFERGSSAQARAQPGTGLGLAITRTLAQIMGGDISATSTPGVGSRFALRLMLVEPAQTPVASVRRRPVTGYAGARRTIVAIDDDPAQLAVLQSLLRPLGFTVFAAGNGAAGIDLALRCAPDLVLLDIQMAGLSGWDVAERLRAIESHARAVEGSAGTNRDAAGIYKSAAGAAGVGAGPARRLAILMVSANAHEYAAGADGRAAHDGFVLKPFDLDVLLDAIAAQLDLDWADPVPAVAPVVAALDLAPLDLAGAAPHLAELRRLGQAGHVRGLEARLQQLADAVPASLPLVAELRDQLKRYDLKAFRERLDACP